MLHIDWALPASRWRGQSTTAFESRLPAMNIGDFKLALKVRTNSSSSMLTTRGVGICIVGALREKVDMAADMPKFRNLRQGRGAGELHSDIRARADVGGFTITEGSYPPALRIHRHDHELASISVVMAGGYHEEFGRKGRHAEAGCVIIHPEGEHHAEVHDPIPTRLITIEIGSEQLQELKSEIGAFNEPWHRTDYSVAALAWRLSFEIAVGEAATRLSIESTVLDMLGMLSRHSWAKPDRGRWLYRIQERLEDDAGGPPSMAELSKLAGVHPVYLARAFRGFFGCTVGTYVRQRQVGRALMLLGNTSLDLSAVALEAGFCDQSHMTRLIRAQTGLPPGVWRKRARLS
jgi:AraC family transcriptional regulator